MSSTEFDSQFAGLYRIAFRVAYRILGSTAEAEDIAQDTLTKAFRKWRRIRKDAPRWVSRVAANGAIDVWRKQRKTDSTGNIELNVDELRRAHNGEPIIERLALVDALSRLSRRQREVVVLRYLAGYPEADVAEILDCSVGSVKTHASRGLDRLRKTMA